MGTANKSYISLVTWVLSLIIIGAIIGNLTKSGVNTWYVHLNKSPLTPPNYIFGVTWSILYVLIGISGWAIWQSKAPQLRLIRILYTTQLILNWSWTPIFFIYHLTGVALICLFLISTIALSIILKTYQKLTIVSLLFIPYLSWLLFAAHLNFYIWRYN